MLTLQESFCVTELIIIFVASRPTQATANSHYWDASHLFGKTVYVYSYGELKYIRTMNSEIIPNCDPEKEVTV